MNGQSASRRRRGGMDTDEDTPRSGDSGGSSALDDETEESLIAKRVERLASSLQVRILLSDRVNIFKKMKAYIRT